jgi:hypothetical protein
MHACPGHFADGDPGRVRRAGVLQQAFPSQAAYAQRDRQFVDHLPGSDIFIQLSPQTTAPGRYSCDRIPPVMKLTQTVPRGLMASTKGYVSWELFYIYAVFCWNSPWHF